MQFPEFDIPSQPATDKWLRETNQRKDVEITVPLAVREDNVPWVMGALIFSSEAVTMIYHNMQSWSLFTEYELNHDIRIYDDDLLHPSVGVVRRDAQTIRQLVSEMTDRILGITGLAFSPYVATDLNEHMESSRANCDCESIAESQVRPAPGLSSIESDRIFMCAYCTEIHGLEYRRRPIPNEKAFDANWVLDGETADGFFDTDRESEYLLYTDGSSIGRLEHVIALMSAVGGSLSNSFSNYVPEKQGGLVYVKDQNLAGYLTWLTEGDGSPALQQLFMREEFRRRGFASTLIETWAKNFCGNDLFYVEEPNEKSRKLLKNLGYMNGGKSLEAVEHFLVRGLTNDLEEGKERAESVSSLQNGI